MCHPTIVHYATFDQFTEAILGFFRKTLPLSGAEFYRTVTDNSDHPRSTNSKSD